MRENKIRKLLRLHTAHTLRTLHKLRTLRTLRKTRHTRKNTKRYRCTRRGGTYAQVTEMTRNGLPVEKGTIAIIPGQPPRTIKEFDEYMSHQYNGGNNY